MKRLIIALIIVCFATPVFALEIGNGFFLNNRIKLEWTDDDRYDYRYEFGTTFGKKGFPIQFSWSHRTDHSDIDGKDNYYYNTYRITYKVPSIGIFKPEFNVERQVYWNDNKVTRGGIQVRF